MTSLLAVEGATVRFGGVTALDGVSIQIQPGALYGIIGPNGSGKTTLIGVITRLVPISAGALYFDGTDYTSVPRHMANRLGIARTFQAMRLLAHMTVRENVMVGAGARVVDRGPIVNWLNPLVAISNERAARDEADHALERVGMGRHADDYPAALSYGMQRRVEIARALCTRPRLLLLDEPVAGMSQAERRDIGVLLQDLRSDGLTQILVEHDLAMIHRVCDDVYALNFGRVVAHGSSREVADNPKVREAYLGHADADGGSAS